jgi:hypothetical protein
MQQASGQTTDHTAGKRANLLTVKQASTKPPIIEHTHQQTTHLRLHPGVGDVVIHVIAVLEEGGCDRVKWNHSAVHDDAREGEQPERRRKVPGSIAKAEHRFKGPADEQCSVWVGMPGPNLTLIQHPKLNFPIAFSNAFA